MCTYRKGVPLHCVQKAMIEPLFEKNAPLQPMVANENDKKWTCKARQSHFFWPCNPWGIIMILENAADGPELLALPNSIPTSTPQYMQPDPAASDVVWFLSPHSVLRPIRSERQMYSKSMLHRIMLRALLL